MGVAIFQEKEKEGAMAAIVALDGETMATIVAPNGETVAVMWVGGDVGWPRHQ